MERKEIYNDEDVAERAQGTQAGLYDVRRAVLDELDSAWEEEVQAYDEFNVIKDEMGDEIEYKSENKFREYFANAMDVDWFIDRLVKSKDFRNSIKGLLEEYAYEQDIPLYLVEY